MTRDTRQAISGLYRSIYYSTQSIARLANDDELNKYKKST